MQTAILLLSFVAIIVFGYYLICRIDKAIHNSKKGKQRIVKPSSIVLSVNRLLHIHPLSSANKTVKVYHREDKSAIHKE